MKKDGFIISSGLCLVLFIIIFGSISLGLAYDNNGVEFNEQILQSDNQVKSKIIYLHNDTSLGTYTMNTTMGNNEKIIQTSNKFVNLTYRVEPEFSGDFNLTGKHTTYIWIKMTDTSGNTNKLNNFTIDLNEVNGTNGNLIQQVKHSYTGEIKDIPGHFIEMSLSTYVDNYTIEKGNSLEIDISLDKPDSPTIYVGFGSENFPSRIEVSTDTYIQPESLKALNYNYKRPNGNVFLTDTSNKTIYFNATVSDPFGGYDIRYVLLTLDSPSERVIDNVMMDRTSLSDDNYLTNFSYQWDYSNATLGRYSVNITVVDQTGYNYRYPDHPGDETYGGHIETYSTDIWISAQRFYINLQTVDSHNEILEDAEIKIFSESNIMVTKEFTDNSGLVNTSLATGNYTFKVFWQDILVNQTTYEHSQNISEDDPLVLNCDVFNPTYEVKDIANLGLESANLYVQHPNGTLLTYVTNEYGFVDLSQMAEGQYEIRTEWLGRKINVTTHNLHSVTDEYKLIDADVYYLTITTMDDQGKIVKDVQVNVEFNDTERIADAKLTNNNGEVVFRLPNTDRGDESFGYDIVCQWRGIYVGNMSGVWLSDNTTVDLYLDIFYLNFHTIDNDGQDLEYTNLQAYNSKTMSFVNSVETDSDGLGTLRLPVGTNIIKASWKGLPVGNMSIVVEDGMNDTYEINCEVYHIAYYLLDSKQEPLEDAEVIIRHQDIGILESTITDQNGTFSTRLPKSSLRLKVNWKGVQILSTTQDIPADIETDGTITMSCEVYYLNIEVRDDIDDPISDAKVNILRDGDIIESSKTNLTGFTDEYRLPTGTYQIETYWKDIEVDSQNYILNSNDYHIVIADVYQVEIKVVDNLEEELSEAKIRVINGDNILNSGTTNENGVIQTKLPIGEHRFIVDWKGVTVYNSIKNVDSYGEIILSADDVYHVTFQLLDSQNNIVKNASINLKVDDVQISTETSDEDGKFSQRIPTPVDDPGDLNVTIYWKNVMVYNKDVIINGNALYDNPNELYTKIYYLDLNVLDNQDKPLEDVRVIDEHSELPLDKNLIEEVFTDTNGEITIRVPRGTQELASYWKDVVIDERTLNVKSDDEITIKADVYYLNMNINDVDGKPIKGALVNIDYIGTDTRFSAMHTGPEGLVQFRIPKEEWDITVKWLDTTIYEDHHAITSEEGSLNLDINSEVYYLDIKTIDKNGDRISEVRLELSAAEKSWIGYTSDGNYTFRLPARDDYILTASYKGTDMLTNIDIDESKDLTVEGSRTETVKFEKYPLPIYSTNFFFLMLGLALLIIIIVILYLKLESTLIEVSNEEVEETEIDEEVSIDEGKIEPEEESIPEDFSEASETTEDINEEL